MVILLALMEEEMKTGGELINELRRKQEGLKFQIYSFKKKTFTWVELIFYFFLYMPFKV